MILELAITMGSHSQNRFRPVIEAYCGILLERVLTPFDDVSAERDRVVAELQSTPLLASYGDDPAYRADLIRGAIESYVQEFAEIAPVFFVTGAVGLFHLFEKQLYLHLNNELGASNNALLGRCFQRVEFWDRAEKIISRFTHSQDCPGPSLQEAFNDKVLRELRLVANAGKHGPGKALAQLQALDAPVVNPSRVEQDWRVGQDSPLGLPLVVKREDLERYRDAVLKFWSVQGTFRESATNEER